MQLHGPWDITCLNLSGFSIFSNNYPLIFIFSWYPFLSACCNPLEGNRFSLPHENFWCSILASTFQNKGHRSFHHFQSLQRKWKNTWVNKTAFSLNSGDILVLPELTVITGHFMDHWFVLETSQGSVCTKTGTLSWVSDVSCLAVGTQVK